MKKHLTRKDVPAANAYLVFHDLFDNGAMEIWPLDSFQAAKDLAEAKNARIEGTGTSDCGSYRAYEKLPRCRVYKIHPENKE